MNSDLRNQPATEKQKEKLRFFGCTWDEGITAGQASDALEECAKQFPDAEAAYQKSLPATELQKDKLRFFVCDWNGDITVRQASDALDEGAEERQRKLNHDESQREAIKRQNKSPRVAADNAPVFIPPTPEQFAEIRSFGKEPPPGLTYQEAAVWIEQCKILYPAKPHGESLASDIGDPSQEAAVLQAETGATPGCLAGKVIKRAGL